MAKMRYETSFFQGVAETMQELMIYATRNPSSVNCSEEKKGLDSINLAIYQAASGIMERLDRIIELLEEQKGK